MHTITRERLRWVRAGRHQFGRHVNHDSRSGSYAHVRTGAQQLRTITHPRHTAVLDQQRLGSCTGNAAAGCMGTGEFFATVTAASKWHRLDEVDAIGMYSRATQLDPWDGWYDPTKDAVDTGSDGLSVAKALTEAGMISGYRHAFTLADALDALMSQPIITGTNWLTNMFTPTAEGLVTPGGDLAGGHEYVADGYDDVRGWVWFTNSWGWGFGLAGRFAMEAEAWGNLLGQDGDVTIFVPPTAPAPVPDPPLDDLAADRTFAAALRPWATGRHVGANAKAAGAVRTWLAARHL
jgi:hypothetical protein